MRWWAHEACVFLLWSALASLLGGASLFSLVSLLAGAILPDYIDLVCRLRHRSRVTHNVLTWGALLVVTAVLMRPLSWVAAGALHHTVIDATTRGGIWVGGRRVRGPLRALSAADNLLVVLLHLLLLIPLLG